PLCATRRTLVRSSLDYLVGAVTSLKRSALLHRPPHHLRCDNIQPSEPNMTYRVPEDLSPVDRRLLSIVGCMPPPRDPDDEDDEDQDEDNESEDEREPPVIREPDEDE